jgi:putative peptidoglycan lipid II flippase
MDPDSPGQHTYRRGIALSTVASLAARGLTFLTAVAIAYRFGTTEATDVYFYCYLLATALVGFVSMLDSMVVIPEVMRLQVQEGWPSAMRFANAALYAYAGAALAVCAVAAFFPVAIASVGSRFSRATLEANQVTVVLVVPLFLSMVICQYLVDLVVSQRYFTVPMVSSAVNNLLALIAILTLGTSRGLEVVPAALTAGFAVQIAALCVLMRRRFAWRFRDVRFQRHERLLGHVALSQAANVAAMIGASLPAYLISGLSPGLLTALQYGQRTAEIPNVILTTQFSSVAGIKFNDLAARRDCRQMDEVFLRSARFLVSVLVPIAVVLSVYAHDTVSLLYAHGKFDDLAVRQTSAFLTGLALILPFLALFTLVSRLTMAQQRIAPWSWFIIGLNIESSLWTFLVIEQFGAAYYPAGVVAFYVVNTAALYAYMRRQHPETSMGAAVGALGRLLPPTAVVASLLLGSRMLLSSWPAWSRIGVGVGLYGTAILLFPSVFLVYPDASEALSHGTLAERARRLLAVARG